MAVHDMQRPQKWTRKDLDTQRHKHRQDTQKVGCITGTMNIKPDQGSAQEVKFHRNLEQHWA